MVSKKSDRHFKKIFESLALLQTLHKDHSAVVIQSQIFDSNIPAKLKKETPSGFSVYFDDPTYAIRTGADLDLKLEFESFRFHSSTVFVNQVGYPKVKAQIHSFHTEGYNRKNKCFYRLIIPLKRKLSFHFLIEETGYSTERSTSREGLSVQYDENVAIDLFLFNDNDHGQDGKMFLIIDADAKLDYNTFSDYCFSTLVAFGYICGQLPQDEGYYFTYEEMEMKTPANIYYSEFRRSLKSMYTPLYANAFGYIRDSRLAEQVYPTLRPISTVEFNRLCNWAFQSVEFSSILLLIIEACASSLLVMPSGLSVALEGLTDLLIQQQNDSLAPILDNSFAKKIRKELSEVLDKNSEHISQDGLNVLKIRINNINQVTNKSKLTKPFQILGFSLSDEDLKAIEHRNDFLHGRITLDMANNKKRGDEIYYISLRLYTLLAVLILKKCGFDNKICNYPKIHEEACGKNLDEPYFRSV